MKKSTAVIFFIPAIMMFIASASFSQDQSQTKPIQRRQHILDSLPSKSYPALSYPDNPASGLVVWGAFLNVTIAPREVVRDQVRQLPQIVGLMRIGLPIGFGVGAKLAGNYIANEFSLTPSWSYSYRNFSAAIQTSPALWFGFADFTGFSTLGMGFANAPGLNLGLKFDDFLLSAKVEFITNYWQYTKFGTDIVKHTATEFEGEAITLSIEQDAFGGARINWGVRLNYTRPDYQLWLAFSDSRLRTLTPEFFFGIVL
jgi:hypothetical protein